MNPYSRLFRRRCRLSLVTALTAALLGGALSACGQMGPLYQPTPEDSRADAGYSSGNSER